MSKLKKQIKRLKKEIRYDNEILVIMKINREQRFEQMCAIRGRLHYQENPLYPKVIPEPTTRPAISLTGLTKAIANFKNNASNAIGKCEAKIRAMDVQIREGERAIVRKRESLTELKELAKS